jgi:hypothetical protein
MKTLLGEFNAKVDTEDICKPTLGKLITILELEQQTLSHPKI